MIAWWTDCIEYIKVQKAWMELSKENLQVLIETEFACYKLKLWLFSNLLNFMTKTIIFFYSPYLFPKASDDRTKHFDHTDQWRMHFEQDQILKWTKN